MLKLQLSDRGALSARVPGRWLFGSIVEPDKMADKKYRVTFEISAEDREAIEAELRPIWEKAQDENPEKEAVTTFDDLFAPSRDREKKPNGRYLVRASTMVLDRNGNKRTVMVFDRSGQRIQTKDYRGASVAAYVDFVAAGGPPAPMTKEQKAKGEKNPERLHLVGYLQKIQIVREASSGLEVEAISEETTALEGDFA